jgi:hypothetical protein
MDDFIGLLRKARDWLAAERISLGSSDVATRERRDVWRNGSSKVVTNGKSRAVTRSPALQQLEHGGRLTSGKTTFHVRDGPALEYTTPSP